MDSKETVKLCNALKDPADKRSPRCLLPVTHHEGKPHRAIDPNGKIVEWPRQAP